MEYELLKENCITNGRFVESGAIAWPEFPIPILARHDWKKIYGTLISIRREDDTIIGVSENFEHDVDLAIDISHVRSVQKRDILHISGGIIRAAVIEEKLPAVAAKPWSEVRERALRTGLITEEGLAEGREKMINSILELHQDDGWSRCKECRHGYPCATVRALIEGE